MATVKELEAALALARAEEAVKSEETPHTALLADLADHRFDAVKLGQTLARVFQAFEVLGIDLLAEDGPARKVEAKASTKAKSETPGGGDK